MGLSLVIDVVYGIIGTLKRVIVNLVIPLFIDLLSDLSFMFNIILQIYYDIAQSTCMVVSKYLLKYAKHCHSKSEELVERSWTNS